MLRTLVFLITLAMTASAAVKIEKVNYKGWPNSYRVTNGEIELVVTSDVGPRIIRFGFVNGQNLFKEFKDTIGKSGEKEWMIRGGHRLWAAPEDPVKTYALDNSPVKVEIEGDVLVVTEPVEQLTGLEKRITVKMAASGTDVELIHRIRNTNSEAVELSPWGLTVMAPGGVGITGFPPRGKHPQVLAPTNPLVMWAYTDFSDSRWVFTEKYLALRQDPKATKPLKVGHFNPKTWGAYLLGSDLFIKRYQADPSKTYPDFGCSYETFPSAEFLEIETLGPMTKIAPGASVEHVEKWNLYKNVPVPEWTDAALDQVFLEKLGK
ncbi:MAG: hypothetical protein ABFD60_15905 [Bryobacteraceae bacterium]